VLKTVTVIKNAKIPENFVKPIFCLLDDVVTCFLTNKFSKVLAGICFRFCNVTVIDLEVLYLYENWEIYDREENITSLPSLFFSRLQHELEELWGVVDLENVV
jgi:hypothetical protein